MSDMILIAASDGNAFFQFTNDTFASLIIYGEQGSGVVNPGLANEIAFYPINGTNIDGLPTSANGILATNNSSVPSITQIIPSAVQDNITRVGTILSGVWNGTSVTVPFGGSGLSTLTPYAILCGGTTATGNMQQVGGLGAIGDVLVSNGPGALPSFQTGIASGIIDTGNLNDLPYYSANPSGKTLSPIAGAINSVLLTSGLGVPSLGQTLPNAVQDNITRLGTVTLGVWNGTKISEIYGGTNQSTYTLGDILYASATNTLSKLAGNTTAAIQYLAQTGTGVISAAPVWTTISGGDITGAALTKADDTNVTLTLGGTPATALLRAASLTLGWTGQLGLTRGGSNASLTADNGGIVYSTATALAILAATATAGQILRSGSNAAPSWSTATYPATAGTSGNVLTSDGTNWVSSAPADANVTITNDTTTNATMYPTWVTANTGTIPLKVTSTKLFYNPSTSVLTNVGPLAQITAIQSSAGLNVAIFNYVASAVNSLALTNSITNTFPVLGVSGTDSNIGINFAVKGTGAYNFLGTSTTAAVVRLFEDTDNGDNYIGLKAPASISANLDFIVPSADGSANFPLITDGSQTLSFGAIAAGAMALLGGSGMSGILNTTYDLSTASGNLDTTGLSFTPSLAIIVAAVSSGDPFSVGWFNGSTTFVAYARNNGGNNWVTSTSATCTLQVSSGNVQSGVASFIAGGVRIAFTKAGTPTGTASISILCFK
jgi:hypothetical protein